MSKWHKGPPPDIGWWPASVSKNQTFLRWWDGSAWSQPATVRWPQRSAGQVAKFKCTAKESASIEWTDRPASWNGRGSATPKEKK